MHFKKILIAGAAVALACASSAQAYDWQGWYIGVNAGWAQSDVDTTRSVGAGAYFSAAEIAAVQASSVRDLDDDGFVGGAQIGYNWQMPGWLLGVEADINSLSLDSAYTLTAPYPAGGKFGSNYTVATSVEQDWLATLRARVGVPIGASLLYATGGLAIGDTEITQSFSDNFSPIALQAVSNDETRVGWTAGVGVEFPIGQMTTVKVEYLHVDLGDTDAVRGIGAGGVHTSRGDAEFTNDIIRVGINIALN